VSLFCGTHSNKIMLHKIFVIRTHDTNPYHNLALEEALLFGVQPGEAILYLWQNRNTVVIGRNQNAEQECRIHNLLSDGGHLVRRLSGGGAVYHDLGNLNFTFLLRREDWDVEKQTEVILRAVQSVGISAEKTGRNDLTAEGCKFSGHAYYKTGDFCYHHGTLMLDVDLNPLEKYLAPSPLKLAAKGVQSVRSRVINLRELNPSLTVEALAEALKKAFGGVYGLPVFPLFEDALGNLSDRIQKFSAPNWIYGENPPLENTRETRFDWGMLRVDWTEEKGTLTQIAVYSDGLEADFLSEVPKKLRGCPMERESVQTALSGGAPEVVEGILTLLFQKMQDTAF